MEFSLLHKDKDTKARAGLIKTAHGEIETPIFMPVGTAGTVKGVHQRELEEDIEAQIILAKEKKLPIVIHARDSFAEIFEAC